MKMDKYIVQASKRKKRRTRRNLDEIRKRTTKRNELQVHGNNYNETICKLVNPKVTNCITNSRLTLANKAIQSKTVTRSLLLNLGKENNENVIVLPIREKAIDSKITNVHNYNDTIKLKVNSNLKSPFRDFTKIENNKTSDSAILFTSPESKVINNKTNYDVLSDSSDSASSYVIHSDNSLYSEFMTNIVNYVQEFASDFLKTDTVFKANFLQNVICNENKTYPSFQTHINKYDVETKFAITENDEVLSHYPNSHNDISVQYTLKHPWSVPSPVFQQSNEINFQKCILSSSSACSGKDSPEYFYYPHRLNN